MAFNNGRWIGANDITLSITDPDTSNVFSLNLNYFSDFNNLGYSRVPIPQTVGATSYNAAGEPITSGVPNFADRVKHRHTFDLNLDDTQYGILQAIYLVSETWRFNEAIDHRVAIADRRGLFKELGNTNTRALADGAIDNTTLPGTVDYFPLFYATFESWQRVFDVSASFGGNTSGVWSGTGEIYTTPKFPCWRVPFTMIEEDKFTP